uniref:Cytochrome P450 n=1 Tax=Rhabditophanes sp. KR3021 TaxID=114890 RepID=A0AC35U2R9_9BILA
MIGSRSIQQVPAYNIHEYLQEESIKSKSDIYTVFIPDPVVVLTSYEAIYEALVKNADLTSGRPVGYPDKFFQLRSNKGVIFSNGDNWQAQRRTSIQILREFGMGKNMMEDRINENIDLMFEWIDKNKNKLVNFHWPIQICISNIITDILFGSTTVHDKSDEFKKLVQLLDDSFKYLRRDKKIYLFSYFNNYPWILSLLEKYVKVNGSLEMKQFREKIEEMTKKTAEAFEKNCEPTNFIHYYLNKAEAFGGNLNINELYDVVGDMMIAGMETTTTTSVAGLSYLGANLDKQEKMRQEIMNVIGGDALITMKDKIRLPYCSAAIMEIQRSSNIVPLNVTHRSTGDLTVKGQFIPKDTLIFAHIHSVLKYDKDFVDSDKFLPERWLDEDLKTMNKSICNKFVPFSLGKRQCAGEGMAVMELFLILTRLIQKYKIVPQFGKAGPSVEPIFGGVLKVPDYEFKIIDV